jgi:hypothetical protein
VEVGERFESRKRGWEFESKRMLRVRVREGNFLSLIVYYLYLIFYPNFPEYISQIPNFA